MPIPTRSDRNTFLSAAAAATIALAAFSQPILAAPVDLGGLAPGEPVSFGNALPAGAEDFSNRYTFTAAAGTSFIGLFRAYDIDVAGYGSLALTNLQYELKKSGSAITGGSGNAAYAFGGTSADSQPYELVVSGAVAGNGGGAYRGAIVAKIAGTPGASSSVVEDLGVLPAGQPLHFGNQFNAGTSGFEDYYFFSVPDDTKFVGIVGALNLSYAPTGSLGIINLMYDINGLSGDAADSPLGTGPEFGLAGLNTSGGLEDYLLIVSGTVNGSNGGAYGGAITAPVPLPGAALAMLSGLGVLVGLATRRRRP